MTIPAIFSALGGAFRGYAQDKEDQVKAALAQQAEARAQQDQKVREATLALTARRSGYVPQGVKTAQMQAASVPVGGGAGVLGLPDVETLAAQGERPSDTLDVPGVGKLDYSAAADPEVLQRKQRAAEAEAQHGYRMEEIAAQHPDRLTPYQEAELHKPQRVPVLNPDGTTTYKWLRPGEEATSAAKPGAGGGGYSQGIQARLLGAVSEARAADKRMRAYEDKMLANPEQATPGLLNQLGGKLATRLSGSHALTGILGETGGEAMTDPEYLQYMRDAGLMARATQLMSSRGGSEAMVAAEQLLNRAVPNPNGLAGSIEAARKSRSAIFGKQGGLMQALTPDQIRKVEAGLEALEKGDATFDYGSVGAILGGQPESTSPSGMSPSAAPAPTRRASDLPPSVDRVKYASDPAYKAWVDGKLGRP